MLQYHACLLVQSHRRCSPTVVIICAEHRPWAHCRVGSMWDSDAMPGESMPRAHIFKEALIARRPNLKTSIATAIMSRIREMKV